MSTELKQNEVFIFGSNSQGFHGAGSAGLACRGDSNNTWRTDPWFLEAMKSPTGSPKRIGKWAILGIARGFQIGTSGKSYAIQTIHRPGMKCSTSLSEIKSQLIELSEFAEDHPEYTFIMTPIGVGYAGWKNAEMKLVWDDVKGQMPSNVIYPDDLYDEVSIHNT